MAQNLTTPVLKTKTIFSVEITKITVDYKRNKTTTEYLTFLEDGTPYVRGTIVDDDTNLLNNASVYARVITAAEAL